MYPGGMPDGGCEKRLETTTLETTLSFAPPIAAHRWSVRFSVRPRRKHAEAYTPTVGWHPAGMRCFGGRDPPAVFAALDRRLMAFILPGYEMSSRI